MNYVDKKNSLDHYVEMTEIMNTRKSLDDVFDLNRVLFFCVK